MSQDLQQEERTARRIAIEVLLLVASFVLGALVLLIFGK